MRQEHQISAKLNTIVQGAVHKVQNSKSNPPKTELLRSYRCERRPKTSTRNTRSSREQAVSRQVCRSLIRVRPRQPTDPGPPARLAAAYDKAVEVNQKYQVRRTLWGMNHVATDQSRKARHSRRSSDPRADRPHQNTLGLGPHLCTAVAQNRAPGRSLERDIRPVVAAGAPADRKAAAPGPRQVSWLCIRARRGLHCASAVDCMEGGAVETRVDKRVCRRKYREAGEGRRRRTVSAWLGPAGASGLTPLRQARRCYATPGGPRRERCCRRRCCCCCCRRRAAGERCCPFGASSGDAVSAIGASLCAPSPLIVIVCRTTAV